MLCDKQIIPDGSVPFHRSVKNCPPAESRPNFQNPPVCRQTSLELGVDQIRREWASVEGHGVVVVRLQSTLRCGSSISGPGVVHQRSVREGLGLYKPFDVSNEARGARHA